LLTDYKILNSCFMLPTSSISQCIGIIMDGNRRWAKAKGLPTFEGHRRGYEKLKEVLSWTKEAKISCLIIYGFSTENWKRSTEEVSYLLDLFRLVFTKELEFFKKENRKIVCVGERERFPEDLRKFMEKAERETSNLSGTTLVLALSYGGRSEIVSAVKKIVTAGVKDITKENFAKFLWTKDLPDPDLIIRTGGEKRLSGFLPWQSVYSELFFTDTQWPDFSKEEFDGVISEFSCRKRNFGK